MPASSPSSSVTTCASMPGSGLPAEPGLVGCSARQRGDHDVAGLRLPPRVDDRAALAADDLVVPEPRLRVDRLADRPEQPQRGQVVLLGVLGAPLDARADRGRRGVEDRDVVAVHERPPDVLVRVVRRALVHHRRAAVGERPVDDVGVPGDPADVGRAPVDVLLGLEVEDDAVRVGDAGQVAAASCAGCPSAWPSSPTSRGCRAGARRRTARPRTRRRPPRAPRGTRRRGRRSSARRCPCA